MVIEYHRMIYYEPADDDPDLDRGCVRYLGDGALLIEYGTITVLADSCLQRGRARATSSGRPPDAILLSTLDPEAATAGDGGGFDVETPVITSPDLVDRVERFDVQSLHPLDTWRGIALRKGDASITITALPGKHPSESAGALMGSMLEFRGYPDAEPYRIYLSGGTAVTDLLDEIPVRFPRIDLGVISLPCTRLADTVVSFVAGQGVEVLGRVRPMVTIPVHRFDHIFTWPLRDFRQALRHATLSSCVRALAPGDRHIFALSARPGVDDGPRLPVPMARYEPGPTIAAGS